MRRPLTLLAVAALIVLGVIIASRHTTTPAGPSADSPTATPATSGTATTRQPWTYLPDMSETIDTQPAIDDLLTEATDTLLIDRWDHNGHLTDWHDTDARLDGLATTGLRVWLTEVPETQTRGLGKPGETLTRIETHPATATLTQWDGTLTIHLAGPTGTRTVSVHARCVPGTDGWLLDAWDVTE